MMDTPSLPAIKPSSLITSSTLLIFSLIVLPLIINPTVSPSFDEIYLQPKIWWIYGVVLPSSLLVIWSERAAFQSSRVRPLLFLLAAFSGWLVISALMTGNRAVTWWGATDRADGVIMHWVYVLVLLAGWALAQDRVARRWTVNALVLSGTLLAVWSVAQQIGLIGVIGEGAFQGVVATVAGGPLGQRGYMGGLLALLLPLTLVSAGRNGRGAWWSFAGAALITWALAGAYTRGTWLAGIVGVGWLMLWGWRTLPRWVWLAVPLGLGLFATTFTLRESIREFNGAKGFLDGSQRTILWKSAEYGIVQRPVFGWGAPAVWQAIAKRPVEEVLRDQEVTDVVAAKPLNVTGHEMPSYLVTHAGGKSDIVEEPVNKVHNEYMDYALTYGLPAALMFTVVLIRSIWSGRRLAPGFSAGMVAYAIYLLTWPEIIRFAPIAWFGMGISLAMGSREHPVTSPGDAEVAGIASSSSP